MTALAEGMKRVVVVDDQELVRAGLEMILASDPSIEVVGSFSNGLEICSWIATNQCEVILMDIRMPQMDGLEATKRICSLGDPPKILILTTYDLDFYVYRALSAGASGFLLKDVSPEDLIGSVHQVCSDEYLVSVIETRDLIGEFAGNIEVIDGDGIEGSARAAVDLNPALLTRRELDIVVLVARGLNNQEIGAELFISENTVKTHLAHIFGKLGIRDRVQIAIFAYEHSLVLPKSL